ncbi:MAG: S-layer homology domain-containing protein, partial [Oscillospiraceae bacterium]|nr:S-layer homology domain-containing protein [Oscillospiraceae bacterium]MBQ3055630.1 S-layer homology domain-containing protein [Oscillospiraceae bacterium]
WAFDAVKAMVGNGFIQGSDGKINPQGNATRAEVAVFLDRIINK